MAPTAIDRRSTPRLAAEFVAAIVLAFGGLALMLAYVGGPWATTAPPRKVNATDARQRVVTFRFAPRPTPPAQVEPGQPKTVTIYYFVRNHGRKRLAFEPLRVFAATAAGPLTVCDWDGSVPTPVLEPGREIPLPFGCTVPAGAGDVVITYRGVRVGTVVV